MDECHNTIVSNEDIKYQRWKESTKILSGTANHYRLQPLSIAVVPDELRKWKENAYMPKVVSIGPRYKVATRDLQQMEQIKWKCTENLLGRTEDRKEALTRCTDAILELDAAVRASYVGEIKLDSYELGTIMLNDGGSEDRVVSLQEGLADLILLENQIPFAILRVLAANIFPGVFGWLKSDQKVGRVCTIENLVRSFLGSPDSTFETNVGHFLELVYVSIFENESHHSETRIPMDMKQESHHSYVDVKACLKSCATKLQAAGITFRTKPADVDNKPSDVDGTCLNRCATKLQAAGITIKLKIEDKGNKHSDVDVKFNPLTGFNFDIEFKNGKLEIPRLHIIERAEARWRNFIAWEHHKMKEKNFINKIGHKRPFSTYKCKCTSAALLFNGLICCANDVQLLKDKKVIVVDQSNVSNQDLVDFFHSIAKGVDPNIIDSNYANMFHILNIYSATSYATLIPIILWHYLTRIPYNT